MNQRGITSRASGTPRDGGPSAARLSAGEGNWTFVYIFFTNHIPFDAPNRSEPCQRH